jgi:hypothetical protein
VDLQTMMETPPPLSCYQSNDPSTKLARKASSPQERLVSAVPKNPITWPGNKRAQRVLSARLGALSVVLRRCHLDGQQYLSTFYHLFPSGWRVLISTVLLLPDFQLGESAAVVDFNPRP